MLAYCQLYLSFAMDTFSSSKICSPHALEMDHARHCAIVTGFRSFCRNTSCHLRSRLRPSHVCCHGMRIVVGGYRRSRNFVRLCQIKSGAKNRQNQNSQKLYESIMNDTAPKISICILAYNHESSIVEEQKIHYIL